LTAFPVGAGVVVPTVRIYAVVCGVWWCAVAYGAVNPDGVFGEVGGVVVGFPYDYYEVVYGFTGFGEGVEGVAGCVEDVGVVGAVLT